MLKRQACILVVDDEAANRQLLEIHLKAAGFQAQCAASGAEALRLVAEGAPDLVLLDLMMPGMDGYEVTARLKEDPATRTVPIILVTALGDREARLRGLQVGAEEFLTKPVDRAELLVRVRNLLRLKELHDLLEDHNRVLEETVALRTLELKDAYRETIHVMTRAAEHKDEETGAHVKRISAYCKEVAEALGMDGPFCQQIYFASPMHDVGKIGIPDAVLLKPGPFTAEEWAIMKTHSVLGAKILAKGESPYLKMGATIASSHHERWDGGGYPHGLKGEQIPLEGRIMNICDQYDALRSRRPYKPALTHERVMEIITQGDGRTVPGHFDPVVLEAFRKRSDQMRETFDSMDD